MFYSVAPRNWVLSILVTQVDTSIILSLLNVKKE